MTGHDHTPSERVTGLRAVFSLPAAYRLAQRLIGAESFRRTLIDDVLAVTPGERILDIGCGTADILDDLPAVDYVGFDHSDDYIRSARNRFGDRGRFVTGAAGTDQLATGHLAPVSERDLAMAIGVLHHLSDEEVREALTLARDMLRPDGRFVSIDPTFAPGQHRIGRWLASRDRGQHVRTPEATQALVAELFPDASVTVRHDLLRVPYSHVICQATRPPG